MASANLDFETECFLYQNNYQATSFDDGLPKLVVNLLLLRMLKAVRHLALCLRLKRLLSGDGCICCQGYCFHDGTGGLAASA
ncbi:hypothetical protein AAE478_006039 [Parahypoxylon ruwenzoriense]